MTSSRWGRAGRLGWLWLLVVVAGCWKQPVEEIQWQAFDGQRAQKHVERLVSYGPRPSGSHGLIRSATYLATQLQEFGLETEEQVFIAATPRGPMQFRNVIGRTRVQRSREPIVIVGSHYDTKWMTNIVFVGANDAGSSSGVLLEMARVATTQPNLWFVFFDGEECMVEYGENDGLWGSKFFVESLKASGDADRVKAFILLDMVGDRDLHIRVPRNTTPALAQRLFDAARQTGHRDVFGVSDASIIDDHVPFLQAGIPALNIIDFEFGSAPGRNDHWHTAEDTLDKVSPRSLEIVGRTTLKLVELLKATESFR